MFDIEQFVSECRMAISKSKKPVAEISRLLQAALEDRDGLLSALPSCGEDEILLHHSQDLTVYRVLVYHGLQYPPHEHGMAVVIGLYAGCETNYLYSRSDRDSSRIVAEGRTDLIAPEVRVFGANVIHSIANLQPEPSAGIHVYMGDLHAQKRSLWNLDLECERPFEEAYYFRWARSLDPLEQPVA